MWFLHNIQPKTSIIALCDIINYIKKLCLDFKSFLDSKSFKKSFSNKNKKDIEKLVSKTKNHFTSFKTNKKLIYKNNKKKVLLLGLASSKTNR